MVAQTTKEVGTFADLKKAIDNIPQFQVVQEKKTAYNNAKANLATAETTAQDAAAAYTSAQNKTTEAQNNYGPFQQNTKSAKATYEAAVVTAEEAKTTAESAAKSLEEAIQNYRDAIQATSEALDNYNTAIGERRNAKSAYDAQQRIVDEWPENDRTTTTQVPEQRNEEAPFPEYKVFYDAVRSGSQDTKTQLHYGIVDVFGMHVIIFATSDIKDDVTNQIQNVDFDEVVWYTTKPITPNTLKGSNINSDLLSFKIGEQSYTPQDCRYYYKEGQTIKYGECSISGMGLTSVQAVILKTYSLVTRMQLVTRMVDKEVDKKGYADAKAEAERLKGLYVAAQETEADKKETYEQKLREENTYKAKRDEAQTAKTDADNTKKNADDAVNSTRAAYTAALNAEAAPLAALQAARDAEAAALTTRNNADAAVTAADTKVTNAKTAYNNAAERIAKDGNSDNKDNEGLIICEDEYKTIAITGSFEVTAKEQAETSNNYLLGDWSEGYTLNGGGAVISGLTKSLFNENKGRISRLATPTDHIANVNNGTVSQCLTYWEGKYRLYGTDGKTFSENASAEELIYQNRLTSPFGYDVIDKVILTAAADNKVFQAKYPNPNTKGELLTFKLNIANDNSLKYNSASLSKDGKPVIQNAVIYLDENDAAATAAARASKNVAVKDEHGDYICYEMELTDAQNAREFYIPADYDFTTEKVTYNRDFNKGYAAVCFPFALTSEVKEALGIENSYQFYEANPTTGVMWFSWWETVPANQPCIITLKDGGNIFDKKTSNFTFEATPGKLVAKDKDEKETFYGTYKYTSITGLLSGNVTDAIYGIQGGELVRAKENANFKAFRSYVRTIGIPTTAGAPSYKIGLMDEDGNELSTAIETVTGEIVSGFKAKGGDNAIEIVTDEACPVKVYALNGALVKSTRVEAGVTSLPVKSGIYVVNGTKVIVK